MVNIDTQIMNIDKNICCSIDLIKFEGVTRGYISQNLLAESRNLVEHIAVKAYSRGEYMVANWDTIPNALEYIKKDNKYLFLRKFHRFLQESKSHYMPSIDGAERLVVKYYEYYVMIRDFAKKEFGMDILHNIDKFPINMDKAVVNYYRAVKGCFDYKYSPVNYSRSERLYVIKSKPIIVDNNVFYENTLLPANDYTSKFDRFIVFSKFMIPDYYAIKADIRNMYISVEGQEMPVNVLNGYQVSIRPCELNNFAKLFGINIAMNQGLAEYQGLMNYLMQTGANILDIIQLPKGQYETIKSYILRKAQTIKFFHAMDKARSIILRGKQGKNIIRYLAYIMRNKVIKNQIADEKNRLLSDLYIKFGAIPFETMPYCTSLINHIPTSQDIYSCIPSENNEPQILAKYIQNNTTVNGKMYTNIEEVKFLGDIDELINSYNNLLYKKHQSRRICRFGDKYLYIAEHYENTKTIIETLVELSKSGLVGYKKYANYWMEQNPGVVNCDEKKEILIDMFEESKVSLIYGAAGTGKTYLINHISQMFREKKKIFLANTNPAVDNLRRKIDTSNCEFMTIAKMLASKRLGIKCDLLIIDECSMVSNADMFYILKKIQYKALILVGDLYQIESISFGNWFALAKYFLPKKSWNELITPYRAKNKQLLELWDKVRGLEDNVTEHIVSNEYSSVLDETIFNKYSDDEIILCLNYSGLYGINNINRFLQNNNPSESVRWGIWTYKVGDPVLFTENSRFSPVLFNNLKGKIVDLEVEDNGDRIWFSIEIDKIINGVDVDDMDLELCNPNEEGNSIVRFYVDKKQDSDDDSDADKNTIVPFQIAYAVSIHKAQGLEYESVKVVITEEVDEMISHNIFYTAITRARSKLRIYWSAESQHKVISRFEKMDARYDANIFAAHSGMKLKKYKSR